MNGGKHLIQSEKASSKPERSPGKRVKLAAPALLVLLLVVFTIGGTMAYLITNTEKIANQFTPAHVSCEVRESFNGTEKSDVRVNNTSDIPAYLRVKLISYRVNDEGERIGGTAAISGLSPDSNWAHYNGYYYYTLPVASGASTDNLLANSITLLSYTDADGGRQVIEVMAEAIQSEPANAIQTAWGVSISAGSVTAYTGN